MPITAIKSSLISFRQILMDFGRRIIKVLKPIRAEMQAEIKKIKSCPRIRIIGNRVISLRNKNKKRYRNIARARLLLERWQAWRLYL